MKKSLLYFHSEGAKPQSDKSKIVLSGRNLIDFMLVVAQLTRVTTIYSVTNNRAKEFSLDVGGNVEQRFLPIKLGAPIFMLLQVTQTLFTLLFGKQSRRLLKESDICVSVGLSGVGTMAACCRVFIGRKNHSFVVRGNRYLTVSQSSRPLLNRWFALFRINLYTRVMIFLVNRGKADIWFQGEAQRINYLEKINHQHHGRLYLLNAVLRELPSVTTTEEREFDLVFTGRLTVEKGLIDLVNALSNLNNSGLRFTLNIIGAGPDEALLKSRVHELGITDLVTFSGYMTNASELTSAVASAKLFILPSYTEGLPRSMLESMYLGTPVLVSNVGGIPFVVKSGVNGFIVEPGSVDGIAAAIKDFFDLRRDSPGSIESIAKKAKLDSMQFTFSNRAKVFLDSAGL